MSNLDHFRLKNEMLFMNYLANTIGVCVVIFITYRPITQQLADAFRLIGRVGWFFDPFCGGLMFVLTLIYERPIRRFLDDQKNGVVTSDLLTVIAQKRLLNEPFFLPEVFTRWSCWHQMPDGILFTIYFCAISRLD